MTFASGGSQGRDIKAVDFGSREKKKKLSIWGDMIDTRKRGQHSKEKYGLSLFGLACAGPTTHLGLVNHLSVPKHFRSFGPFGRRLSREKRGTTFYVCELQLCSLLSFDNTPSC
jgi:hypothetical protein